VAKTQRRPLFRMLAKLKKRGLVEELPGGRYRLGGRKVVSGERDKAERSTGSVARQGGGDSTSPGVRALGRDEVRGRLVLHHDGYGFVVPDKPMPQLDGDVFIPPSAIQDAMHGDHVLAKLERISPSRGGAGGQRAEGRIVRVLGRAHPSVVGLFRFGPRGSTVLPYDTRLQQEIEIPPKDGLAPALLLPLAGRPAPGPRFVLASDRPARP